jgi:hypothetical protein
MRHAISDAQIGERSIFRVNKGPSLPRTALPLLPVVRRRGRTAGNPSHVRPRFPSCPQCW